MRTICAIEGRCWRWRSAGGCMSSICAIEGRLFNKLTLLPLIIYLFKHITSVTSPILFNSNSIFSRCSRLVESGGSSIHNKFCNSSHFFCSLCNLSLRSFISEPFLNCSNLLLCMSSSSSFSCFLSLRNSYLQNIPLNSRTTFSSSFNLSSWCIHFHFVMNFKIWKELSNLNWTTLQRTDLLCWEPQPVSYSLF